MSDIITLLLPSLFDGFVSAVIVGFIVWLVQKKYEENATKHSIYENRIIKVEDEFYKDVKEAKYCFNRIIVSWKNGYSANNEEFVKISDLLFSGSNKCQCEKCTLQKYQTLMNQLVHDYNRFVSYCRNPDDDIKMFQKSFGDIVELIENDFYSIDKIYFDKKK